MSAVTDSNLWHLFFFGRPMGASLALGSHKLARLLSPAKPAIPRRKGPEHTLACSCCICNVNIIVDIKWDRFHTTGLYFTHQLPHRARLERDANEQGSARRLLSGKPSIRSRSHRSRGRSSSSYRRSSKWDGMMVTRESWFHGSSAVHCASGYRSFAAYVYYCKHLKIEDGRPIYRPAKPRFRLSSL